MLAGPRWLALDVKYLDRAASFYRSVLDLSVVDERDGEIGFAVGDSTLCLRAPGGVPRGGLHTHYALSIPDEEYDTWYDRLDERFDLIEHTFGDARSLYFDDPDGHCVELGERPTDGDGMAGLFEVVLEVETLSEAEQFYATLGFEVVDRGTDRRRVRMAADSFAIELWEPQLGLADARGGVHVDLGIGADDPGVLARSVADAARSVTSVDGGIRVRDPDGHYLTLCYP